MDQTQYRTHVERIWKTTPQGDLWVSLDFPYDWLPSDQRPGVVFLHGGGWSGGTREQLARHAAFLAARGLVTARFSYRVRGEHGTGVDACVQDGFDAMRWFRGHAAELGVDPDRIVGAGSSAGAHVAACTATLDPWPAGEGIPDLSPRPNALVLFNPALDVFNRPALGDFPCDAELQPQVDATAHLDASLPPTYVWYGTDDPLMPYGRPFIDKARTLGVPVRVTWSEGAGHGDYLRVPAFFHDSVQGMADFLAEVGYL